MTSLLDTAINALHIQSVLLRNLSMVFADDFEPGLATIQMGMQLRHRPIERRGMTVKAEDGSDVNVVRFRYECGLRYIDVSGQATEPAPDEAAEPKVVAELIAVFSVDYAVTQGAEISDEAVELFGKRNVGYHVWPFWRELTQSHAARAMLPLPVIPFYQAPKD